MCLVLDPLHERLAILRITHSGGGTRTVFPHMIDLHQLLVCLHSGEKLHTLVLRDAAVTEHIHTEPQRNAQEQQLIERSVAINVDVHMLDQQAGSITTHINGGKVETVDIQFCHSHLFLLEMYISLGFLRVLLQISVVQCFLRTERHLTLAQFQEGVGTLTVHDTAVLVILQSIVDGAQQVGTQVGIIDGGKDLHSADKVARHPVGRAEEVFVMTAVTEDEDTGMFKIAVDDADTMDILTHPFHTGHQRAVAADDDIYLHSSLRNLIELLHDILVGDMIDLHLHPCFLACLGILNLRVEQVDDPVLHGVGRYHQLAEDRMDIGFLNEVKHLCHFLDNSRARRHHEIVGVNLGVALVKITGPDTGDVTFLRFDIEQFGVHLPGLPRRR